MASSTYLENLLLYYEEEVSGVVYYRELGKRIGNAEAKAKLDLLAVVEAYTAKAVKPLITKYGLSAKRGAEMHEIGVRHAIKDSHYDWASYIDYVSKYFAKYIDDFLALEEMAPTEDLPILKVMTDHEIAVVEFAKLEVANDPNSLAPIHHFLNGQGLR